MSRIRNKIYLNLNACGINLKNCWKWVQCHKPIIFVLQDQYNVICLGTNGSGKTTILKNLTEDNLNEIIKPTNGFYIKTLPIKNIILSIKEIGGSKHLQKYWPNYFDGKQAILFVVNSIETKENLYEARDILKNVLRDERLENKPCFILATHSDMPNSKNDYELKLIFKNIMQNRKWTLHCCSSFNKTQVLKNFEILIDMMIS